MSRRLDVAGKVLAIRREDQSVWERRAPLAPDHVRQLVKDGVKVLVQPSSRRAYPAQAYANARACIQEDISEASVILGVKQVPIDALIPDKTYCFFSHTIKASEDNMPMLDALLEKNIRLIDYEKMVDDTGQRVVAFGMYAGMAGMLNILHGLGLRLLALGHHTPFMHIGPAHSYRTTDIARAAVRDAGYEISLGHLPKSLGVLTFTFTGSGNVSKGAQDMFRELPIEMVPPEVLPKVCSQGQHNKLYGCQVSRKHHYKRNKGGRFDAAEFAEHPERYYSSFSKTNIRLIDYEKMVDDTGQRVVAFGMYAGMAGMLNILHGLGLRLLALGHHTPFMHIGPAHSYRTTDIARAAVRDAGYEISLGHLPKSLGVLTFTFTGSGNVSKGAQDMFRELPIEMVPPEVLPKVCSQGQHNKLYGCQVSRKHHYKRNKGGRFDSAEFAEHPERYYSSFSKTIAPYTSVLVNGVYWSQEFPRLITLPDAKHLCEPVVAPWLAPCPGAPTLPHRLVAVCDISADLDGSIEFTVDCTTIDNPFWIYDPVHHTTHQNGLMAPGFLLCSIDNMPTQLPRESTHFFGELLLPHIYSILQSDAKKSMDDTHLSPEVTSVAVAAGITIVNEVGLDPGIDHLLAMEYIDSVHLKGGKIESFVSYCGGLPAPEHSENPLRYKFSWSPRGVLLNALSGAKYVLDGKIIEVPPGALMSSAEPVGFLPGFALEGYPNRDSLIYQEMYGISEAKTVLRGTLRYFGFAET
ncbi:unnamed protein product, partial [Notodromas monacha]